MKQRVLFVCTGNSARSQMAEGLLRALGGDRFEVASAGTEPVGLNPLATEAMAQLGIDISDQRSDATSTFVGQTFDYVVTVCGHAAENCPVFPGEGERLHWGFEDPAAVEGSHEERLEAFRQTRDLIQSRVEGWLARS